MPGPKTATIILLKRTKKSFVVLAQNEIRRISECLQAFLSLLLGGGVALP
jgi:hypothetical protein